MNKGEYGQFFTANEMCERILIKLNEIEEIKGVCLEPSLGEGAFLKQLEKYNIDHIDGVEIDKEHLDKCVTKNENVSLYNEDFLYFNTDYKYDFIVGNPPYIELCYSFYDKEKQNEIKNEYKDITKGRINLVHIFLKKSFEMIKDGGLICYLLPSAILTSPIYNNLRKEIYEKFTIEYLEENVNFKDVAIKVSLIIIRKNKLNDNYFYVNNTDYFIMENYDIFKKSKSIKEMGFDVNIGEVVWNQKKEILSDNPNDKILLYSTNIGQNTLDFSNNRKRKQYINMDNIKHERCIVFPRTVSKKIKFYYIKNNKNIIFENHVLVLKHNDVEMLDAFYEKLNSGLYDDLLLSFFNSSNLTKTELLSLPF